MKLHSRNWLASIPLLASLVTLRLAAATPTMLSTVAPDTTNWKCRFCQFNYGFSGYLDGGVIAVDQGHYRFGKYSGLLHSGLYPMLGGALRYRNASGDYFNLLATRLGLSSRALSLQGGRQGLLEFSSSFQGIPYNLYNGAQTPFLGIGSSWLSLPINWVSGATTAQMSALQSDLRSVGVRSKRQIYRFGIRFLPPKTHWTTEARFRHDRQTGNQVTGANFLTTSSLLTAPVDYDTNQIDASAQYLRDRWQIRFAYYGSFFHAADSALVWSNPFTPFTSGADLGRMGVAPDNAFNQISLSGAWQLLPSTRLMASAALGQAMQDDTFIPITINSNLQPAALSQASLDGRVDTGNYTVRLTSMPIRGLSLIAEYVEDRHDDKTSQAAYQQVGTDVYVGGTQANLPYSFDRATSRLIVDYRLKHALKFELGGEGRRYDRSYAAVGRTYTTSVWGQIRTAFSSRFGLSVKYKRSHRTVGDYREVPNIFLMENPLLRKYNMADRIRNQILASAYFMPLPSVSLGLSLENDKDDYDQSPIGLTGAENYVFNLTANWTPTHGASAYVYLERQIISADQAGSQSGSVADWYGHTSDWVNSVGMGGRWKEVLPRLDVGADCIFSYTRESIGVQLGSPGTPQFPNNVVRELSLQLFSRYHLSPHSSLRLDYAYERYLTTDWALNGVQPATIPNVLTLGVTSPSYRVNLIALSYRYTF